MQEQALAAVPDRRPGAPRRACPGCSTHGVLEQVVSGLARAAASDGDAVSRRPRRGPELPSRRPPSARNSSLSRGGCRRASAGEACRARARRRPRKELADEGRGDRHPVERREEARDGGACPGGGPVVADPVGIAVVPEHALLRLAATPIVRLPVRRARRASRPPWRRRVPASDSSRRSRRRSGRGHRAPRAWRRSGRARPSGWRSRRARARRGSAAAGNRSNAPRRRGRASARASRIARSPAPARRRPRCHGRTRRRAARRAPTTRAKAVVEACRREGPSKDVDRRARRLRRGRRDRVEGMPGAARRRNFGSDDVDRRRQPGRCRAGLGRARRGARRARRSRRRREPLARRRSPSRHRDGSWKSPPRHRRRPWLRLSPSPSRRRDAARGSGPCDRRRGRARPRSSPTSAREAPDEAGEIGRGQPRIAAILVDLVAGRLDQHGRARVAPSGERGAQDGLVRRADGRDAGGLSRAASGEEIVQGVAHALRLMSGASSFPR